MSRISHREFRSWLAWRKDQLNSPSRSDQYLMQIAGEVRHVLDGKKWNVSDFMLTFSKTNPHSPAEARRALARRRGEDI